MRRKVEYYSGHEITEEVLKKIHLIELKRLEEGITQFPLESINTLDELCQYYETTPSQENIILGEDWYINYNKIADYEMEINEWVAISAVSNKLGQTIEMYEALKKILLESEFRDIYIVSRHSTSYRLYQSLLRRGYIEEFDNTTDILENLPTELEQIKQKIIAEYGSLENYLKDENREKYEEFHLEDYIYHLIIFSITDKFVNKYKR